MSLIAHYPLNGDVLDYSKNRNHLINNGALIDNAGKIGKCYHCNNHSNFLESTNEILINKTISIFTWINVFDINSDTMAGTINLHNHSTCSNMGINVKKQGEGYVITCNIGYMDDTREYNLKRGSTIMEYGKWYNLGLIYDESIKTIKLYVNGAEDGSWVLAKNVKNSPQKISISRWSEGYSHYRITGKFNDVRIYDHALSQREISDIYKTKILHYNFNNMVEPTVNGIVSQNLDNLVGYTGIVTEVIDEKESPINKALKIIYTDALDNTSARIRINVHDEFKDGRVKSLSFSAKGEGSSIGKTPHTYTGDNWITFENPLTDKYQRYSISSTCSNNSGGPLTISLKNEAVPGDVIYVHSPQIENKNHQTEFTPSERLENTIIDISGFENHATIDKDNPPRWINDSNLGSGAYDFDGSQEITCSGSVLPTEGKQEWTVSAWLKFNEAPDTIQYLINTNLGVRVHHSRQRALNYINNGTSDWYRYSDSVMNDTEWFHLASSFDEENSIIKIWKNGIDITAYGPDGLDNPVPRGVHSIMRLFQNFNGKASDIRIYATALTDEDILHLYNSKASISKDSKFYVNEIIEDDSYCDYVKGINLMRNGAGEYGDTTNINDDSVVLITDDGVSSKRCFEIASFKTIMSTDFIEVNPNNVYEIGGHFKSIGEGGLSRLYYGVSCYDENKVLITHTVSACYDSTKTILSQDINNGDTIIHLESVNNWAVGTQGSSAYNKYIGIHNLPSHHNYSRASYVSQYTNVDTENNTITLLNPWSRGHVKAGTRIANNFDGGNYNYTVCSNHSLSTDWTFYSDTITGISDGVGDNHIFRAGTKYIKLLLLVNYAQDNSYVTRFTDLYIKNLTNPQQNLEVTGFNVSKNSIATAKELIEIQPEAGLIFHTNLEKDNYIDEISGDELYSTNNFTRYIQTPNGLMVPYLNNIPGVDENAQFFSITKDLPALHRKYDHLDYTMSIAFYTETDEHMTEAIMFGKSGNHHGMMCHLSDIGFRSTTTDYISNAFTIIHPNISIVDEMLNKWNMITTSYSKGIYRTYLNGELKSEYTIKDGYQMTNIQTHTWIFAGGSQWWSNYKFIGALTDARIYNRALSDKEVMQNYQAFMNQTFKIDKEGNIYSREFIEV